MGKAKEFAEKFYGKELKVIDVDGKPVYSDSFAFTMITDPDHPAEFIKKSNVKIDSKKDTSVMCQIYQSGGTGNFLYELDNVFINKGILDGVNEFITENDIDVEVFIDKQERNPVILKGKDVLFAIAPMKKQKGEFYAKGSLSDFKKLTKKTMKQLKEEILTHDNHTFQGKKDKDNLERDSKETLVCKRMFLDKDVYIEDN